MIQNAIERLNRSIFFLKFFQKTIDIFLRMCYYIITGNERVPK